MMLRIIGAVLLLFFSTSCINQNNEDRVIVATASNMQYAMKALVAQFNANHDLQIDLITQSSGKLTTQIFGGAPYDIFISANKAYPDTVSKVKGLNDAKPFAMGHLILWSTTYTDLSIEYLQSLNVERIAVGNPKFAPYGIAAAEVISSLSIDQKVDKKLVYGESIAQVNQFIQTGSCDIGFTSLSTIYTSNANKDGSWVRIPDSLYHPIQQYALQLDSSHQTSVFFDYLFTEEAKQVLTQFGYGTL